MANRTDSHIRSPRAPSPSRVRHEVLTAELVDALRLNGIQIWDRGFVYAEDPDFPGTQLWQALSSCPWEAG
jgi:hypothetical protein